MRSNSRLLGHRTRAVLKVPSPLSQPSGFSVEEEDCLIVIMGALRALKNMKHAMESFCFSFLAFLKK